MRSTPVCREGPLLPPAPSPALVCLLWKQPADPKVRKAKTSSGGTPALSGPLPAPSFSSGGNENPQSPGCLGRPRSRLWDCTQGGSPRKEGSRGEGQAALCPPHSVPREDRLATCSSGPACGEIWGWRVIRGTGEVPTPPAAAAPARGSLQSALSSRSLGRLSPRPWPWLRLGPGLARPCPHVARLRTESRSGLARSQ